MPQSTTATTTAVNWEEVRAQFNLDPTYLHLASSQFIASHPRPVRQAIAHYRQALDAKPVQYTLEQENNRMQEVRELAATYMALNDPDDIALTDSTTMGLGTLYTGLNLRPGQEILTTEHDHYSHHESIRLATGRSGATFRKVPMYQELSEVTEDEMVAAIRGAVAERTRVVGITWVHSSTGLKTPVGKIARAIAEINEHRDEANRVLLLVDGVHGFGIERETFPDLGCDYFITSGHKWLYGPRGTGFVAATRAAWQQVSPIIPSYTDSMDMIIEDKDRPDYMDGKQMTPGGFHSLEHRWALAEAFRYLESLGREAVYERVHQLARQCKEGLAAMPHVQLLTPLDDALSAGIVSFKVKGMSTEDVVSRLLKKKVVATKSPYFDSCPRFTPGIYNTPQEVEQGLEAVWALGRGRG